MKRSTITCSSFAVFTALLSVIFQTDVFAQISGNSLSVRYTYPSSGAKEVSANTKIGIRFGENLSRSNLLVSALRITGNKSGFHTGKLILTQNQRMLIFSPDKQFAEGEVINVIVGPIVSATGKNTVPYHFSFTVTKAKIFSTPAPIFRNEFSNNQQTIDGSFFNQEISSSSLPEDFPKLALLTKDNPAPGDIYLANYQFVTAQNSTYMMILDNNANPIFYRSTTPHFAMDFTPQPNGCYTYFDERLSEFFAMDSNFVVIDSFKAENGYQTDGHEFRFLPNGNYVMLALSVEEIDMRNFVTYGDSNATLLSSIIQEFDRDKNLVFEWRTTDHFKITDATYEFLGFSLIDFVHSNSIEFDRDGSFLLSSRNMDEITKIDRETGDIVWRWGGNNNEFQILNDSVRFSHQHSVRRLPNGNIIMFDNGNFHLTRDPFSRAVEYSLDEVHKTATRVWEFRHSPDLYSASMGSVQRLDNGNTLIGWGACDGVAVSEIRPDGSTALEIGMKEGNYSYRAYKFTKEQTKVNVRPGSLIQTSHLDQNYPNPVQQTTSIPFSLSGSGSVTLILYDALGRQIKTLFNGNVGAGDYLAKLDAASLPNGAYIYKLNTSEGTISKTLIISK